MSAGIVPAVSRRAVAGVSRRASLLVAAAVLGATSVPLETQAGKAGKKARKRCKQQKGECLAGIEAFCLYRQHPCRSARVHRDVRLVLQFADPLRRALQHGVPDANGFRRVNWLIRFSRRNDASTASAALALLRVENGQEFSWRDDLDFLIGSQSLQLPVSRPKVRHAGAQRCRHCEIVCKVGNNVGYWFGDFGDRGITAPASLPSVPVRNQLRLHLAQHA